MYQQLTLIGNLGNDPEMRYTSSGVPVTSFRLAVNRRWTGADGQVQDKTNWFRINTWRKQAELANQYLGKGRRVMVIGEVDEARAWTDRDGNLQATIEVTARDIRFMDSKNGSNNGAQEALEAAGPSEEAPDGKGEIPF